MIYTDKEPIQILWDMTKTLYTTNKIPIFKEIMHEETEDTPDSYILLRSQITDTTRQFGDGKSLIRSADCDIILVTKGYADDTTDLHNINKKIIRNHLNGQGINFDEFNLGYDRELQSTQHTFSLGVDYIGT